MENVSFITLGFFQFLLTVYPEFETSKCSENMHTQHFALGRVSSRRLCVKSSFILVLVSSKFRLLVFTSRVLSRLASLLGFLQCLFTVFQLSFAVSLFDQSLLTIGFFQFHLTVYPWFAGAPRNTRSSHLAPRTFWKFSFIYPS